MNKTHPLAKIFDEIFDRNLKTSQTQVEAFDEAEKEFEAEYKHKRYSNLESYRKCRGNRIKKRKYSQ